MKLVILALAVPPMGTALIVLLSVLWHRGQGIEPEDPALDLRPLRNTLRRATRKPNA